MIMLAINWLILLAVSEKFVSKVILFDPSHRAMITRASMGEGP